MMQIYVVSSMSCSSFLHICCVGRTSCSSAVPHHALLNLPGHHDTWLTYFITVMARGREALWDAGPALQSPKSIHEWARVPLYTTIYYTTLHD